ncbi:hypothetical protein LZ30DRAFT_109546 [Colletotrichum cereale]|nr:hypothetical protein LZ30DRAFT_109546 [Colletotrichum cereale]
MGVFWSFFSSRVSDPFFPSVVSFSLSLSLSLSLSVLCLCLPVTVSLSVCLPKLMRDGKKVELVGLWWRKNKRIAKSAAGARRLNATLLPATLALTSVVFFGLDGSLDGLGWVWLVGLVLVYGLLCGFKRGVVFLDSQSGSFRLIFPPSLSGACLTLSPSCLPFFLSILSLPGTTVRESREPRPRASPPPLAVCLFVFAFPSLLLFCHCHCSALLARCDAPETSNERIGPLSDGNGANHRPQRRPARPASSPIVSGFPR